MNDAVTDLNTSVPSMRRTVLTLLGAFVAFAVLTASYATAELPSGALDATATGSIGEGPAQR